MIRLLGGILSSITFITLIAWGFYELSKEEKYTITVIGKGGSWKSSFFVKGYENYDFLLKRLRDDCLILHTYEKVIDNYNNAFCFVRELKKSVENIKIINE